MSEPRSVVDELNLLSMVLFERAEQSTLPGTVVYADLHLLRLVEGWLVRFTGWKTQHDSSRLVGQLLATRPCTEAEWHRITGGTSGWPVSRFHLVSSMPGTCRLYLPGDCFDTTVQPGQEVLDAFRLPVSTEETTKLIFRVLAAGMDSLVKEITRIEALLRAEREDR